MRSGVTAMDKAVNPAANTGDRDAYPFELRCAEEELLKKRPKHAGVDFDRDSLVGFALSGGGIRSATFCLGVFQGLAKLNLLNEVDYASSVSGGGYFTSMFGRIFAREDFQPAELAGILAPDQTQPANAAPAGWKRGLFHWLRENGRYLSPRGAGDLMLDLTVMLRNWVALQVVMGVFIFALFVGARLIRELLSCLIATLGFAPLRWLVLLPQRFLSAGIWWSPFILVFFLILLFAALPFGAGYWMIGAWESGGAPDTTAAEHKLYNRELWRMRFSVALKIALIAAGAVLAFALVDSLGQTAYVLLKLNNHKMKEWIAGFFAPIIAIAPFAKWLYAAAAPNRKSSRLSIPLNLIAGVAAAVVIIPVLIAVDGFSHAVAFKFAVPDRAPCELTMQPEPVAFTGSAKIEITGNEGSATMKTSGTFQATGTPRPPRPRESSGSVFWLVICFAISALASLIMRGRVFLNRSSMQALYSSRLIRAYLGASNESRYGAVAENISDVVKGDDIAQQEYWSANGSGRLKYEKGAPIHLVNVTINETVDGRSQIEQRDRRGLGMAVGPAAISAAVNHHVIFDSTASPNGQYNKVTIYPQIPAREGAANKENHSIFRIFDYPDDKYIGDKLSLGRWVGISGAAISTGLGSRTSLGLSLLMGFFNVRLGYWWDSGITDDMRARKRPKENVRRSLLRTLAKALPVQSALLNEFSSRFPGPDRQYWNLSDGGHFENLGSYELIRRRLRTIVIIDAGGDPDYDFEDLANLVRKARLDFNAEVTLLESSDEVQDALTALKKRFPDINDSYFGILDELRRGRRIREPISDKLEKLLFKSSNETRLSLKHATLAKVTYPDGHDPSYLILIKPTLTGDESLDLLSYHQAHPSFPHETTADQFFDEAQWESYRKLGEHITTQVLGNLQ
jgi:hypothetical protein